MFRPLLPESPEPAGSLLIPIAALAFVVLTFIAIPFMYVPTVRAAPTVVKPDAPIYQGTFLDDRKPGPPLFVVVTETSIRISESVSIPIGSLNEIEFVDKRALRIVYGEPGEVRELVLSGRKRRLGGSDRASVKALAKAVTWAWKVGSGKAACDGCGGVPAAWIQGGYFFGVGFWPIIGAWEWGPKLRFVCEKHARRGFWADGIWTSLVGYWGIPSLLFAPVQIWRNAAALAKGYPSSRRVAAVAALVMVVIPMASIGAATVWLLFIPH